METSARPRDAEPGDRSTLVSAALIPVGLVVLISFGGQIVFAPFVLVIEWVLARVAKGVVKIAWSMLAGVMAGEYVYLLIDLRTDYSGFLAVVAGLAAAVIVAFAYLATTGGRSTGSRTGETTNER
ncbi:MAG: hypothetical protein WCE80_06270 [Acidimicrobiia bacterium]